MDLLGENITLDTLDIPADSPAAPYRELVASIMSDPTIRGAVITAHKTAVYEHAADLLDGIDKMAEQLGEVSVIYRTGTSLRGTVIEHRSITRALTDMGNGTPITRSDADVMVFGAGGTAVALIAALKATSWPDPARPHTLHLVDVSADRLHHAQNVAHRGPHPLRVHIHLSDGSIRLSDLPDLPARSLIINATGLGKDRPGTPLELPAVWPEQAHVWDLNYRGDLPMLSDAERALGDLQIHVHNGWALFIHGWAESLSQILCRTIAGSLRQRMDELARKARQ